ncbi:MFS transporter [Paenibacillus guangzhouensis]|uniref:MFS transporter n=1 Tax=Paenibacillus guangzhouensis TaxID=1473112 RepID=UPI002AB15C36|nr:MFS transporter [Paenibacillus guangzhouensis]
MHRLTIYLLALGVFFTATAEIVVSGILPMIARDLGISIALAGQLITAYSLAFAIGTPIVVALTARLERRLVLVSALIAFMLGSAVAVSGTDITILMVSRVILGVSAGVYLVVALGVVAKLVSAERIGGSIGTIILGFSAAMILGVPMGIAIASWLNWQAIFIVLGVLSLFVTLALYRLLPQLDGEAPIPWQQQVKVLGSTVIVSGLLLTFFRESGNSVFFTYVAPFMTDMLQMDIRRALA